ncbi:MAG: DNA-binding protein, partial [Gallionellaceae bacterium]
QDGKPCMTHDLWFGLNEKIHEYLAGVNLQQLVDGQVKSADDSAPITVSKSARAPMQVPA